MKAASINEIKQELITLPPKKVFELCLQLARFKKENKEYLSFLLFEAHDEHSYVMNIKKEIDEEFNELPKANWYLTKKTLRKILKSITKYSKHVAKTESSVEMLIHFCTRLNKMEFSFRMNSAFVNLYKQQLKKLDNLVDQVHEDLRFDYKKLIDELR